MLSAELSSISNEQGELRLDEEASADESLEKDMGTGEWNQKSFLLTYPHCELERAVVGEHLKSLGGVVVVVAREMHKDGEPHIHAWVEFVKKKHIVGCRVFDVRGFHANIGKIKNAKRNTRGNGLKYVLKEDKEPWSFGIDLEAWKASSKKHRAYVGELLITGKKTVREVVEEFPQEIYNIDKLIKNVNLFKVLGREIPPVIPRRNYWIVGKPRVGKSYAVREAFGKDLFIKPINKWWDGYAGESVVLLDDFDKNHQVLGHYMKIWADNYSFNGEVKGGMIVPGYKMLVVTSNYEIKDIWDDKVLVEAIEARFTVLDFASRDEQIDIIETLRGDNDSKAENK